MLEQVGHQQFNKFSLDHHRQTPEPLAEDDLPVTEMIDLNAPREREKTPDVGKDVIFLNSSQVEAALAKQKLKDKALETQAMEKIENATFQSTIDRMNRLWPETKGMQPPSSKIEQGPKGNCYAISALDAIKQNQFVFLELMERITENPTGGWDVRFYDDTLGADEVIHVDPNELQLPTSMKTGGDGDRIIERAYQSFVARKKQREFGGTEDIGKTFEMKARVINGKETTAMDWEAGQGYKALNAMLGADYEKHLVRKDQAKMVEALHYMAADQKKNLSDRRIVATVYTKQDVPPHPKKEPKWKFWKTKEKDPTPDFIYGAHAYSVQSVNIEQGSVQIVNPHDTSKIQNVDFATFFKYFNGISYVQKRTSEPNPAWVNKTVYH